MSKLTVAEYEQQLCLQRKLLDSGLQPKAEEQEWTLDPPRASTHEGGTRRKGLNDDDEEEKPELPQLHPRLAEKDLKTEADDCDGPGRVRNPGLDRCLQAAPENTFKDTWTHSDVQLLVLIKEEDSAEDQEAPLELHLELLADQDHNLTSDPAMNQSLLRGAAVWSR
ncbi:uncharacterized protein V6R79_016309 [Siganus canaliculatus]